MFQPKSKSRFIEDHLFIRFFSKSYQLLLVNCCFYISWFPFLLFYLLSDYRIEKSFFFFLFSLPIGASLGALIKTTQIICQKNENVSFKLYFLQFKSSFIQSSFSYLISCLALVILFADFLFLKNHLNSLILIPTFLSLVAILFSTVFNYFLLPSTAKKTIQIIKNSFALTIKKWYVSLLLILLFLVWLITFEYNIQFSLLFLPSSFIYLLLKININH